MNFSSIENAQHFIVDWMGYITFAIFILLFIGILRTEPAYYVEAVFIFTYFALNFQFRILFILYFYRQM
jgi:hypothetical protein